MPFMKPIMTADNTFIFHVVVAHSFPEYGIGYKNALPWNLPKEMKRFKEVTTRCYEPVHSKSLSHITISWEENSAKNIVVFGRTTWESIPDRGKKSILKDRKVIVITGTPETYVNCQPFSDLGLVSYCKWEDLKDTLTSLTNDIGYGKLRNQVFFAGGASIYKQAFETFPISCCHVSEVYLNEKANTSPFDTFFESYNPHNWKLSHRANLYYQHNAQSYSQDGLTRFVLRDYSDYEQDTNTLTGEPTWFIYKMYATDYFMREYYIYGTNTHYKHPYKCPRSLECNTGIYKSPSHTCLLYRHKESQYLDIMNSILEHGVENVDRTGVGTLSVFGTRQHYDLRDSFPMLTTRRQWLKGIFEELKLYLSGKTDNAILQEKNIHIWDGNTSREFLDKRGLMDYPVGDMGETYGFNFRHFGGHYVDCKTEYSPECGYDQLANVIHLLKHDPTSRRILINLWNPHTLHKAALPSCLMMYQFYVNTRDNTLHCQIYIRSSDFFLANNWNTCTGALLVHMLCALEDIPYTPGSITVITGDTHIYKSHIKQAKENLERQPVNFPKLIIKPHKKYTSLDEIEFSDLRVIGYQPQPSIYAEMAV